MSSIRQSAFDVRHFRRPLPTLSPRLIGLLLFATLVALYGLLINPFWIRGGDSEVYLSLARSIQEGHGLRFNGQPVGLVPPGWPLLLAGMMRLSSQFAVLKLMLLLMLVASLVLYFHVLRQMVGTWIAVTAVLLAAALPAVYQMTYQFLAEGIFCLIVAAALLVALRINRNNAGTWSIVALTSLCLAALTMRWTLVLFWPLIAAVLLRDELWPRWSARWIAAAVSGLVSAVAFVGLRQALRVDPRTVDPRFDASLSTEYAIVSKTDTDDTLASRLRDTDRWLAQLLWPSLNTPGQRVIERVCAGLFLLMLAVAAVRDLLRCQWVWLAVLLYYGALCVNWPSPVPRYLVPVAPLLLAGIFEGLNTLKQIVPRPAVTAMCSAIILSVAVPNALEFAGHACDFRSAAFYQRLQNGSDQSLTQSAQLLRAADLRHGELAVSTYRATRSGSITTNAWMRAMHFLTGKSIRSVPAEMAAEPSAALVDWMQHNRVRYYLFLPAIPSSDQMHLRFWRDFTAKHFDSAWRLYRLKNGQLQRLRIIDDHLNWPVAVPTS